MQLTIKYTDRHGRQQTVTASMTLEEAQRYIDNIGGRWVPISWAEQRRQYWPDDMLGKTNGSTTEVQSSRG